MAKVEKKKLGLVPKLLMGIAVGIIIGLLGAKFGGFFEVIIRIMATFSSFFGRFLNFIIPFMVLGFVVSGISELGKGAAKLLGITAGLSYGSTVLAGSLSYVMARLIFPRFIERKEEAITTVAGLKPFFEIPLVPMFDVLGAIFLAFMLGLAISIIRHKSPEKNFLYNVFNEFSDVISMVLSAVVIPLLPLYIAGSFANMAYTGEVFQVLAIFLKVFACVISLHVLYLLFMFVIAGAASGNKVGTMMKNQVTPYLTAIGTQSSAATIPVNVEAAKKNGVSKGIREFVVPLCATIHLAGSIITLSACVVAVLMMNGMDFSPKTFFPFMLMLGVAMVAAPGTPGGAVMSALPFMYMVGIGVESDMAKLLITLYITQDSFGTAANVSGDNAIAVIVDSIYHKMIAKGTAEAPVSEQV